MSNSHIPKGNPNTLTPATVNGQLDTPALTPISEHGDQGDAPFPNYEEDVDHVMQNGHVNGFTKGNTNDESHMEQREQSSTRRNSGQEASSQKTSVPTSPRTASGETPKMLKLSPNELQALT